MKQNQVNNLLEKARDLFLNSDHELLAIDANERSLTHKFAEHLQSVLSAAYPNDGLVVDCEYNRDGSGSKTLDRLRDVFVDQSVDIGDRKAVTIYPDIIVHKRGDAGPNVLIIEAKKDPNDMEIRQDLAKIKAIKRYYYYEHGVFLKFYLKDKVIDWEYVLS